MTNVDSSLDWYSAAPAAGRIASPIHRGLAPVAAAPTASFAAAVSARGTGKRSVAPFAELRGRWSGKAEAGTRVQAACPRTILLVASERAAFDRPPTDCEITR